MCMDKQFGGLGMILVKDYYLNIIRDHLGLLSYCIDKQNGSLRFDINRASENFYADFLNLVYGYELSNGNIKISKNLSVIDLVDEKNQIAVQVTSDNSVRKIRETLKGFKEKTYKGKRFSDVFKRLVILIITEKNDKSYKNLPNIDIRFNPSEDIWDGQDIIDYLDGFGSDPDSLERLRSISEFLKRNIKLQTDHSDCFGENISSFYEYICEKMTHVSSVCKLYGSFSLLESYIEPTINDRNGIGQSVKATNEIEKITINSMIGHNQTVKEYLETWIKGNDYLTIICGEPGHGKSSLCYKAMYDFYIERWLSNYVENVFCFSLNPAGTGSKAVSDQQILVDFNALLSWGDDGKRQESYRQIGDIETCQNALIFLDGFDELLEWLPGFTMEEFLEVVLDYIERFSDDKKPHIIITTRKMAISQNKEAYSLSKDIRIPIKELNLISETQQYEWILRHSSRSYYNWYTRMYSNLKPKDELKKILGVPIIFRMIVVAEYKPKGGSHLTAIYDDLFHDTWKRHNVKKDKKHDERYFKKKLSRHALKVYADNQVSTEIDEIIGEEESSWLYAFYTKYDEQCDTINPSRKLRVGFWHKTFYEYFLSCEIVSWFQLLEEERLQLSKGVYVQFIDMLSFLCKKKLSKEVLLSIKILFLKNQKSNERKTQIRKNALEFAYQILKETDGILKLPVYDVGDKTQTDEIYTIHKYLNEISSMLSKDSSLSPLVRGNNVFWNIISICTMCDFSLNAEFVNEFALRHYDMSDCWMTNAKLNKCDLKGSNFERAHLKGAEMKRSDLKNINLTDAELTNAKLNYSKISSATLLNANLTGAFLNEASLRETDLRGANLYGAHLEHTDLSDADLRDAELIKVSFFQEASDYFYNEGLYGHLSANSPPDTPEFYGRARRSQWNEIKFDNAVMLKAKIDQEGAELLKNKFGLDPEEEGMVIEKKDYTQAIVTNKKDTKTVWDKHLKK